MSRMIKALNNCQISQKQTGEVNVVGQNISFNKERLNKSGYDGLMRIEETNSYNNEDNEVKHSVSIGLMVLVAMVAVVSMFVSYKAMQSTAESRSASLKLLNEYNMQKQNLEQLKGELVILKQGDDEGIKEIHGLKKQINGITKDIEQNQAEVNELVVDQNFLKMEVEDLKRLEDVITERFIKLNDKMDEMTGQNI